MIDELKQIANKEIDILREIATLSKRAEEAEPGEKLLLENGLASLTLQMKRINSMIPDVLSAPSIAQIGEKKRWMKSGKLDDNLIYSELKNRDKIMRELEISESLVRRVRNKKKGEDEDKLVEFRESRGYLKLSNRVFLGTAKSLMKKGYFADIPSEVKKANLDILSETYVAMILFSTFLSIFVALAAIMVLLYMNMLTFVWAPLLIPAVVFFSLYVYPSAEKKSIAKKIEDELPFAVIHMSSISGSGIEPTAIFKIIAMGREYPFLRKELRKVINQINIYGYDFVTALNNVSKGTSSQKLAELFNGLSATISSGGSLSEFFQKRAETLMVGYKLEKEKFIKVAETFMDIYIAVVIAAPMILMLLLVMISVSGIQTGFSPKELTVITISAVALINVLFLFFLQAKQT